MIMFIVLIYLELLSIIFYMNKSFLLRRVFNSYLLYINSNKIIVRFLFFHVKDDNYTIQTISNKKVDDIDIE